MNVEFGITVERKNSRPPLFKQVHSGEIIEVGPNQAQVTPEADGAFTFAPDFLLYVFTADCLPVLFYTEDPEGPIAAVHSGWRGAKQHIVENARYRLAGWEKKLHAWLGPCLLPCCFEVKQDFIDEFKSGSEHLITHDEKTFFDLPRFVIDRQLNGIPRSRIHTETLRCTYCSVPELPSFRRNKSTDPQICSWIKKSL